MKKHGKIVNGILLLDKPYGVSSNGALQRVKRLFNARKAGHTGSLDPLASGLLPLCFGEATKFSQYLLESDKRYLVEAKLGVRTTTSDAEGDVVAEKPVPNLSNAVLEAALDNFRGEIDQVPSMFSALKYQGQPLYKLARQGITVERPSRRLTIYDLTLLKANKDMLELDVHCSKGTYIRTIVDDLGELLECGAHVTGLRRISVGPYQEHQMITMETLEAIEADKDWPALQKLLLPADTAVAHWPEVRLIASMSLCLRQGHPISVPQAPTSGWVRLLEKGGEFFGVGEILPDGRVAPRRLVNQA